jgi:hypothetical protein
MTGMPFTPPIRFLVFNRPGTTARVFGKIRKARPTRLYTAAGRPQSPKAGEAETSSSCTSNQLICLGL